MGDDRKLAEDWWATSIIKMRPGEIRMRGYAVEDLIGRVTYPQMVWLMTRGELPTEAQARLLEAAMVAGVDHGPQAPSIAISRIAVTGGVGINGAMASAINVLDDVHGGAGEQAVELYHEIDAAGGPEAVPEVLARQAAAGMKYLPGFGHRFHPVDPRAPRLLSLIDDAVAAGTVEGRFAAIARAIDAHLRRTKSRPVPMNIDGATAAIYAELGFAPPLCRGLFILSRSVGILAHAYEQSLGSQRNKGPIPRQWLWTYEGPENRKLPGDGD
ncbi:citryl-CoA lyase [Paracoccus sp. MA]|uniref:citryl-CoA lyase n=1 Tax=unclassified Paracoccus (in: a-proteobacteria) TaxID=2688777 RepID=UPI0004915073|nr:MULTISPECIES: citryl-CoA lyase [unclassified Paracoccus (in: a-proteobacteria)]UFM66580.1 citryl-CoA lyase [Paracoccus sp. MA]